MVTPCGRLKTTYPGSIPRFAVIAVIDDDMYFPKRDWRFAFGIKGPSYGVLSTVRMDPGARAAERELTEARLKKMLLRYTGELYLGLPRNGDPRSVLGSAPMGVQELDHLSEEFCAARPGSPISC